MGLSIKDGLTGILLRRGPLFKKISGELAASEFLPSEQLMELQNRKLQRVIHHAYKYVPYYGKLFDRNGIRPHDIKTADDLPKIPFLTRQLLVDNFEDLRSRRYPRLILREEHSSGTTGSSCRFLRDIRQINFEHAVVWRHRHAAGIYESDRIANIPGGEIIPIAQRNPPFWFEDKAQNLLKLSIHHVTQESIPLYLEAIRAHGSVALQTYPMMAHYIALYLDSHNMTFPLKAVFTQSQPVFPFQRELIERAFECRVWDYYGLGERVACATECGAHDGLHISEEYGVLELIDDKGNVARDEGNIAGTGLNSFSMPLIRYLTNDHGRYVHGECACGRHSRKLAFVEGRLSDMIMRPDGETLVPFVFSRLFWAMKHIAKSQIIQQSLDEFDIKVVPLDESFDTEDRPVLLQSLHHVIGEDVRINIQIVEDIPLINGKYRWLICNIK